jgi:hypothetical protein
MFFLEFPAFPVFIYSFEFNIFHTWNKYVIVLFRFII